ncbi:unnamed protein product [Allacma fusca]|uniref:Uncharacterized protein n=1 Tax=Allacma fusca TaxID=39272 RepID=A0A8J2L1Y5_9HEXA|nr:unnamed protein product [Allacma fusca]
MVMAGEIKSNAPELDEDVLLMRALRDMNLPNSSGKAKSRGIVLKFSQILVPTVDTEKITWILKLMEKVKRPTVLIGETGTSKTATAQSYVNALGQ